MAKYRIDVNCDMGEIAYEEAPHLIRLLDFISSCNVATGFHAGDPHTILQTIRQAHQRNVAIGVHPSYPDRPGFGRISMDQSESELYASLYYQTSALSGLCSSVGARLQHLKLHGALYHDAHHKEKVAQVVIRFLLDWPYPLLLYGQKGSLLEKRAREEGIVYIAEEFLDRRYNSDCTLVARNHDKAIISDPDEAVAQAINIIKGNRIKTVDDAHILLEAQTICIHGDHSYALTLAQQLHASLDRENIVLTPPGL